MNGKFSVFVICVKAIIYLLLHKLHDYIFKKKIARQMFLSTHYPNKLLLETQEKFFSSQIFENVIIGFK